VLNVDHVGASIGISRSRSAEGPVDFFDARCIIVEVGLTVQHIGKDSAQSQCEEDSIVLVETHLRLANNLGGGATITTNGRASKGFRFRRWSIELAPELLKSVTEREDEANENGSS